MPHAHILAQLVVNRRINQASQKSITAVAFSSPGTFLGGTAEGRILSFSPSTGDSINVRGTGHSSLISGLAVEPEDSGVFSIGYDDQVREIRGSAMEIAFT